MTLLHDFLPSQSSHGLDALKGVVSFGCLARQHDTVGTVEDSVGHVRAFSASGAGLLHHGLKHLSGADHRLASLPGKK